jgi:hypothetical protein
VSERRWFEVTGLRIRRTPRLVNPGYLTLVDACEARDELAACVDELAAKLDVARPPSRSGSDD